MLREPFRPESVGTLPKPYRKDSPKGDCPECGQYHGLPAVHLSYVGHASVTDRLLTVDPWWTWDFLYLGEDGQPVADRDGGMWMSVTIAEVTRKGYGDGPDMKQRIGDGLRNAGMRFGIALDLWTKDELESLIGNEKAKASRRKAPASSTPTTGARVTGRDAATANLQGTTVHQRNAITKALAALDPPVRDKDAVTFKINDLLQAVDVDRETRKERLTSLAKLTVGEYEALARILKIDAPAAPAKDSE
jgi:hypothetical protein